MDVFTCPKVLATHSGVSPHKMAFQYLALSSSVQFPKNFTQIDRIYWIIMIFLSFITFRTKVMKNNQPAAEEVKINGGD